MNPGHNESLANAPFVGPSGLLLKKLLEPCPPCPTYLTNAARCSTPGFEPVDAHYRACAPWLLEDLHAISTAHEGTPLVVLCLGSAATQQLHRLAALKRPKVTSCFSKQGTTLVLSPLGPPTKGTKGISSDTPGCLPAICHWTYHPAAVLREPSLQASVRDHLQLLFDFLKGISAKPSKPHLVPPAPPRTT